MNNIISNFDQIIEQARNDGMPEGKRRGILREYLQTKLLVHLYAKPRAKTLSFIGGTCLRIFHGINRFSEDLDFDNLGLPKSDLSRLLAEVTDEFNRENIEVELTAKLQEGMAYHQLRFPRLLFDLKMTTDPREKLMIKIDYSTQWRGQKPETALLSRYGLIERIITNPLSQIMVQKLAAYVTRPRTQPRDMFDIVWLWSRGVQPDKKFMKVNRVEDVVNRARKKFEAEGAGEIILRRLRPFLFDEKEIRKVKLLGEVLEKLR